MNTPQVLAIERMGWRGEGVAGGESGPIYIPYALPGETVRATVEGDRGTVQEVLIASSDRATPFCPHFGTCGGCLLQHWESAGYRAWKRGLVEQAMRRAGLTAEVAKLIDAGGAGRRRATIHARKAGAGFMAIRSHRVHDIDHCPILVRELGAAFDIARAIGGRAGDCDVAVTASDTGLDLMVKAARITDGLALVPFAERFGLARLSLNGETVIERIAPTIAIGRAKVKLPVASFLQATAEGERILAASVCEALAKSKRVADLFCGIGPFALRLAERVRIFAVDNDRAGLAALSEAARNTQGLKPIETARRDLHREPLTAHELAPFDAVVFDPPRAGAEAQATQLARSGVKTVVAVSCDPASFARDAAILVAGGYRLQSVTPVDQFVWSAHLEIVGVFVR